MTRGVEAAFARRIIAFVVLLASVAVKRCSIVRLRHVIRLILVPEKERAAFARTAVTSKAEILPMIGKMNAPSTASSDNETDQLAFMVAASLLPKSISGKTLRQMAVGFHRYEDQAAPIDWTRYYTCMRPFEQQLAMVKFIPEEWLRGLPDFLKMVFSDYIELRGDPTPVPKEIIQSWFNEFFLPERSMGARRTAG